MKLKPIYANRIQRISYIVIHNIKFIFYSLFVSILLFCCSSEPTESDDCDNCTDLTGLYLGQELPGETPKIFKPFNNSDDIFEWNYIFSMNGEECVFTRVGGEYKTSTMMMGRGLNL